MPTLKEMRPIELHKKSVFIEIGRFSNHVISKNVSILKFYDKKSLKYRCLKLMTFPFLSLFVIMTFPILSSLSAYFQKCHYLYIHLYSR